MATRDYKHAGNKKNQRSLPGWVWLMSGLAIGLFVALLVYLDDAPAPEVTAKPSITVTKPTQDTRDVRQDDAEEIPAPPRPRFDFYTLLPELEVVVPEDQIDGERSPEARESAPRVVTQDGQFLLQAGSFKQYEEADRLKASLALLGVQANIQKVEVNDDTWHRVRIGPITSLAEINDIRARLKANDIDTMLLKAR